MKKIAILAGIAILSFLIIFIPGYFLFVPSDAGELASTNSASAPMNPCAPQ